MAFVYDANRQSLSFNGGVGKVGNGTATGDIVLFSKVITIDGQPIDAVITTVKVDNGVKFSSYDSTANPYSNTAYFQPNITVNTPGAGVAFKIEFVKGGSYVSAADHGVPVTLQNVIVNSYDIDSAGGSDRQYQEFGGFSSYTLGNGSRLSATTSGDLTHFQALTSTNNSAAPGTVTGDQYRVQANYNSIQEFQFKVGVANGTGTAYFALDFSPGSAFAVPINYTNPTVVQTTTFDTTPTLIGTYSPTVSGSPGTTVSNVVVVVDGVSYTTANGLSLDPANGTWSLTTDTLSRGIYDVGISVTYSNGAVVTDTTSNELLIDAVLAVNTPPAGADKTILTGENGGHVLVAADFGFSDSDGHALANVEITTLPTLGSLTLNGVAVTPGQYISAADIAAGKLLFTPAANAFGDNYANFTFQVQDDGGTDNGGVDLDPTPNTITFNVSPINHAPAGADKAITTAENGAHIFAAADFGFSDPDGHDLANVEITSLPSHGSLKLNGVAVTPGQFVSAADIAAGKLVFTPAANAFGDGYANFTFQVQDDGGTAGGGVDLDPTPNTITFTVATNRPLSVNNADVNEASPFAVFTITGVDGDKVKLALSEDGVGPGHATQGVDYDAALEYLDGGVWKAYTPGSDVTLEGTTLLVRTAINNDTILEGPETFRLIATNAVGSATGVGTIRDEGTGHIFTPDNTSGIPNSFGDPGYPAALDNDGASITVSGGQFNEASPRAIFEINAPTGLPLTLDVVDVAPDGSRPTTGLDNAPLYYSLDGGGTWHQYTGQPVAAGDLPVLVAVDITAERDDVYEGEELFQLVVNPGQPTEKSAYSSIFDDGTGTITAPISPLTTNNAGGDDPAYAKDDDRPIHVYGGVYNEGSPRAIFTVDANPGQALTLDVRDVAAYGEKATTGLDNADIYYSLDNGATWAKYTGAAFTAGVADVLVAVDIAAEQDNVFEGVEQLQLVVNADQSTQSAAFSAIVDDGTGVVTAVIDATTTNNTGGNIPSAPRDDDRPIKVFGGEYNEASPRAVFTVEASDGQSLKFDVRDAAPPGGNPTHGLDTAPLFYSLDSGATWQSYTGAPINAGPTAVLVAVDISAEHDNVYEGTEYLELVVNPGNSTESYGFAAIIDSGDGSITHVIDQLTRNDTGAPVPAASLDNDYTPPVTPPPPPPPPVDPTPDPILPVGLLDDSGHGSICR